MGKGLGLGPKLVGELSSVVVVVVWRGLASGEGEVFFSKLVNFEERRPRMEPPLPLVSFLSKTSSPLLERSFGANSLVGEVKLAASPVVLIN